MTISLVGFLDILCQIEYGTSILNCTNEQIENAYNDLFTEVQKNEISMIELI